MNSIKFLIFDIKICIITNGSASFPGLCRQPPADEEERELGDVGRLEPELGLKLYCLGESEMAGRGQELTEKKSLS